MNLESLVRKNRSYRRFYEEVEINYETLESCVNLARLSPSARNMQSLRYKIINQAEINQQIFPLLKWAGYLKDWDGPIKGERPSAYIVVLNDEELSNNYYCDDGLSTQSIMLGAIEKGFGGCIIAAINRPKLKEILNIDDKYKIIHILAIGKPKEEVILDDIKNNDIKYWRDRDEKHHVPKRTLKEIIL